MENQDQNTGVTYDGGGAGQASNLGAGLDPANMGALSLDPTILSQPPPAVAAADPKTKTSVIVRALKRADVILVALLVIGLIGLVIANVQKKPTTTANNSIAGQYNTVQIPLSGFIANEQGVNFGSSSVIVNGSLKLNDGLIVSPSVQPNAPKSGQIYFDQNTNQLAYYNGTAFVPLSASGAVVQSIGGVSGDVILGGGLSVVGNQLANGGVLSFGGQTGAITVGDGLKMTGNTLQSAGVLSLTPGTANLQIANDGNGNLTISSVGAGTGTVSSAGGISGQLAVFTGAQTIGDSVISQSGTTVTVTGNLNVSGIVNLTSPLGVASGGTGANTFAPNGVLLGNGASAISTVTAAGPGLCLVSTAGAPAFASCTGGSTVTSLDGLSGALTIANSTGAGSVVTINDASSVAKGIASFNSTNFTVTTGAVNTVQNISSTSTPTFSGVNTNAITPSGALTVGAGAQSFTLQGNAASTIVSAGGGGTTTVGFTGTPTGAVNYNFDRAAAPNTYVICTTAGNCVGIGSSITGTGTSGTLPVFTGAQSLGDSLLSQSGGTVGVNGNLNLTVGSQYRINGAQISSANLSNDASLAKLNATQTFTGATNTFQNSSDSALAFSVQNASGNRVLSVNTTTGQAILGQSSTLDGRLVFMNSTNGNTGTVQTAALGQNTVYTLPDPGAGSATICVSTGNCSGAAVTLQAAYTNSTDPEIVLDATRGALTIRDNVAPIAANLFEVQSNNGASTYLAVTSTGVIVGGTTTSAGNINTTGGTIQTNSITRIDNSGNLSNIGSATLSGAISGGTTYTGSGNINTTGGGLQTNSVTRVDNSGNLINIGSITASGNATIQGGNVTIGTAAQAGLLVLSDGSSNTGTVQTAALGQNTVYTLPDPGAGTATICVSTGNCSGTAVSLQGAYDNSTDPEIVLDATRGALTIRDNASSLGANLLEVQSNNGSTTYFAVTALGASTTGTLAATSNINSISGALQTNNTTRIDNSGNASNIGTIALSGSISGGTTYTGSGNINTTGGGLQTNSVTRVDNSGNLTNIGNVTGTGAVTIASSGAGNNVIIDGANQLVVQDVATFNATSTFNNSVSLALANSQNLSLTNTATGTSAVNLISSVLTNNTTGGAQQVALLQNATGSGVTEALLHLDNADATNAVAKGLQITAAGAAGITNALDVSDPNIVTALLFGLNDISGTNFSVTGSSGAVLSAGNGTFQGGTLTLGAAAQGGALVLSDGSANSGTLQTASLGQDTVYTLPDPGGATATICLTTGNCAGTGGGVTGSGTANRLAKFSGTGSVIGDSTISDNGTTVSTTGNLVIQGGTATLGVASSQSGGLALANSGSGFLGTVKSNALGQATDFILPDPGSASATFCLSSGNCTGSGSSSTLQAAYNAGNTISTTSARNIDFTLATGGTNANFTITTAAGATGFTTFSLANGSNATPAAQLVLVKNNDTNEVLAAGIAVQAAAGGITTAFDASGANITNALSIGANAIAGTNFSVSGAGAVTAVGVNSGAGLLQGTGGLTVTGAASINATGTANTSIGNGTGSLAIASSGLNVTAGGAVSGVSTLSTSGIITAGTLGSANTSTFLCRNGSNEIATCSTTGSGVAFVQGGNSFSAAADLGTNDGQPLNFRTSGTTKLTLSTGGDLTYASGSGGFDQSASSGTFKTGTGNVSVNGDTTVAAGKNLSLASGAGVLSQAYTNSAAGNAQNITIANTNTGAGVIIQGINLTPTNTATASSGTNVLNVINLAAGGALGGTDQTNGINFASATGYTNFIKTPTAALTSGGALTGLTGVTLTSGNVSTPGNISTTGSGNIASAGTVSVGSFAAASSTAVCSNAGVLSTCNANPSSVTLQQAYAAGNTISTTGNDIAFTMNSAQNFTVTSAAGATGSSVFSLANGANPSAPSQLVLVKNNDTDEVVGIGVSVQAAAGGGITTAFDASGANITTALAIGAHAISGTNFSVTAAGAITAVSLSASGNINTTGGTIQTDSTDRISNGGNLVNIGTVSTSGAINGQTINTASTFTGTVAIQGASALTLGTSTSNTGAIIFKGSGGSGTLTLQGPTTPNASNFTLSMPAITANATVCSNNLATSGCIANQFGSAQVANFFIQGNGDHTEGILKASVGQTADIFQVQDSNGSPLFQIDSNTSLATVNDNLVVNAPSTSQASIVAIAPSNGGNVVIDVQRLNTNSVARITNDGLLALGNSAVGIGGKVAIEDNATGYYGNFLGNSLLTGDRNYYLPNSTGTICLDIGNCGSINGTLQAAYGFSAGGSTPEIKLDNIQAGIDIQDADFSLGSSANFLSLRASNNSGLGNILVGFGIDGNIFMQPNVNRTDFIDINNNGGNNLLTVDSSNNRVGIALGGSVLPAYKLDVGGDINMSTGGVLRIGGTSTLTAGALSFSAASTNSIAAASSQALTIASTNFNVSAAGAVTLPGGQTSDVLAAAINTANGTGSTLTLTAGNSTSNTCGTACAGGVMSIQGGNATGSSGTRNGGAVSIEGGTGATANGAINIGTVNNSNITVGKSNGGTLSLLGGTGGINLGTGGVANTLQIGNITGAVSQTINLGTNATASSTSLVTIGSATTAANSVTIEAGNTGGINIGNGATAHTINIGNGAAVQGITIGSTNSTSALTLQSGSAGTSILSSGNVTIGAADANGTLLVFDTKNTAGDPTGVNGAMYYNSNSGKFRCYQNSTWSDCITASGGFVSLQNAYTNSTGGSTSEIILDGTRGTLDIQDQSTSNGGSIAANLLNIRATAANDTTLGTLMFSVGNTGAVLSKNSSNSATAFQIQNALATATVLDVDTTNQRVGIGTAAPARTLDIATNDSNTTAPALRLLQGGTGDATVDLNTTAGSIFLGVDNSDGGSLKLSSNVANGGTITAGFNSTNFPNMDAGNANQVGASQITSGASSGTLNTIRVFFQNPTGSAQVALYADTGSNLPGALLSTSQQQTVVEGWNTFSMPSVAISASTKYWIGFDVSDNNLRYPYFNAGPSAYQNSTFGTMPSPFGTPTNTSGVLSYDVNMVYTTGSTDSFTGNVLSVSSTGVTTFKNATDSTSAFRVQNSSANSILTINTSDSTAGINLVTNSGFENGTSGWAKRGSVPTFISTMQQHHSGNDALYVEGGNAAGDGAKYNITLTTTAAYIITFYARLGPSEAQMFTLAAGYSSDGSTDTTPCSLSTTSLTGTGWTRVECTLTAPGTNSGTPFFYVKQTDASTRDMYFDDFFIALDTSTTTDNNSNGSIDLQGSISSPLLVRGNSNTTDLFNIQTSTSTNVMSVGTLDPTNGITNPSFELNDVGWSPTSNATVGQDSTQAWVGSASLKVTTTANGLAGAAFNTGNTNPTKLIQIQQYTLSWYAKLSSGTFTDIKARYTRNGSSFVECTPSFQTVSTTGWTRFSCTFTTDATAPTASADIRIVQTGATAHTFWIDGVRLEAGAAASSYGAGTLAFDAVINSPVNIRNTANSTGAFNIQNAAGSSMFNVDTLNNQVVVGPSGGDTNGMVLVLGVKTIYTGGAQAGDPTGVAGAMYYNSALGQFRCYEFDHWRDCLESVNTSYHYTNDMTGNAADSSADFDPGVAGAFGSVNGEIGHPGIVTMETNTGGAGSTITTLARTSGSNIIRLGNGDYWRYETALRIRTASGLSGSGQTYTVRAGFNNDGSTGADPTNGCFFKYTDTVNTGKWQGVCTTASTPTTCDTTITVAVDTWYHLTVAVNAAGTSADFQVNGVSKCQVATVPTGSTQQTNWANSLTKNAGTTNRFIDVDYFDVLGQLGTRR